MKQINLVKALMLVQLKEMLFDRALIIFVAIFPFFFLFLFYFLSKLNSGDGSDLLATSLPLALVVCSTNCSIMITSGPLAKYRNSGALTALATTPLPKSLFIATHAVLRLIFVSTVSLLTVTCGIWLNMAQNARFLSVFFAVTLANLFFLSLAYLIGALSSSDQAAGYFGGLVMVLTIFGSGLGVPLASLPSWLGYAIKLLPTSFGGGVITQALGSPWPVGYSTFWVVSGCLVWTVACCVLAIKTFRWK